MAKVKYHYEIIIRQSGASVLEAKSSSIKEIKKYIYQVDLPEDLRERVWKMTRSVSRRHRSKLTIYQHYEVSIRCYRETVDERNPELVAISQFERFRDEEYGYFIEEDGSLSFFPLHEISMEEIELEKEDPGIARWLSQERPLCFRVEDVWDELEADEVECYLPQLWNEWVYYQRVLFQIKYGVTYEQAIAEEAAKQVGRDTASVCGIR